MTSMRGNLPGKAAASLAIVIMTAFTLGQVANAAVAEPAAATDENRLQSPDTDIAKKKGNLSDKLDSTNGVIHPEGSVDPGIQQPTPPAGPMPVFPPPGAPGGDPRLQPK
jgi:hypothetical protein